MNSPLKPIVLVFAGPNGSGKTTVAQELPAFGTYVNADAKLRQLIGKV